eukprot:TCONS_00049536-protein
MIDNQLSDSGNLSCVYFTECWRVTIEKRVVRVENVTSSFICSVRLRTMSFKTREQVTNKMAENSPVPEVVEAIKCYLCLKQSKNTWDRNRFTKSLQDTINHTGAKYFVKVAEETFICQSCKRMMEKLKNLLKLRDRIVDMVMDEHKTLIDTNEEEVDEPVSVRSFACQTELSFAVSKSEVTRSFVYVSWPSGSRITEVDGEFSPTIFKSTRKEDLLG